VKASFDENLYTTRLDVSNIDVSRRAEAERIAREIEGTSSTNMHIAEERNQAIATDYDEEDRYSGVLTKDLKARAVVVSSPAAEGVKDDGEKKAAAPAVGKVMNYAAAAQAAAKKGSGKSSAKPAATATTASASASVSKVSEDAEKAATSADKASPPPPAESQLAKVSLEEEGAGPEATDAMGRAEGDDKKDSTVDEGNAKKDESEKDEKKAAASTKLKLNPNAKAFTFNPTAKTFTPSFASPSSPPAVAMMQQPLPMDAQMMPAHLLVDYSGGPHMMGNMGPGGPQFVPMHGEKSLDFDMIALSIPYLFC
jgi:hypothetical protein